jgi:malonyl-CoA decarboxylase
MREPDSGSLLERTRDRLRQTWRDVVGAARVKLTGTVRPDLPDEDLARLRQQIDECLEARGGEVSARARAADLGRIYLDLSDLGKGRFLGTLSRHYGVDRGLLTQAMAALQNSSVDTEYLKAEQRLRDTLVPPRIKLLRHFNGLSEGVKFLVDLRADLIRLSRSDPVLKPLDRDLRELLTSWFDVGFLELRRITWDAPAALLEKLVDYEAVHEIRSWSDLKNRLKSDRRCYAFFHPSMPDEPLIFVEVALVDGMAGNVQSLLDEQAPAQDPRTADSAIFYSISNTQKGLAGVSFGNFLIKQVVGDLARDLRNIKTFATLSPIPGFRDWLGALSGDRDPILTPAEARALRDIAPEGEAPVNLGDLLDHPNWIDNSDLAGTLEPILLRLCAAYLLRENHGDGTADAVAHFHLTNGARIERINWLADRSSKGVGQSAGMMVNYVYKLAEIELNHEAYRGEGKIPASSAVRALL